MPEKRQEFPRRQSDQSAVRKYFIYAGIAVACVVTGWYLYRLHLQKMTPGMQVKIDPVWAQFVNVALIFFACIFQFSLLHKLYALIVRTVRRRRQ